MIKAHESNTNKNARMKKDKYEAGRDVIAKRVKDGSELQGFFKYLGFLNEIMFLDNVKFSTYMCILMHVCNYKR